ncbi:nitrite reductase small subunit NirD [Reinekea blandensis]|uniref:Nitrite reductase n=1 Tax=Reinekea blandensis MED297 TaxID=314283 RepID=A4BAX4_9GAMM|nr:nitrite reductase small subunit NirD [Reinekea blandensis]EAR10587.1 nitrite reductase [Reinekea sp. MED297] [Reinekea blandensis MED297]
MTVAQQSWQAVCTQSDLFEYSGVAIKVQGQSIALFYLPDHEPQIYAVDHYDPLCDANVIARGIVGTQQGELCVASPLYKQHYSLISGQCLEDADARLNVWPCRLESGEVWIQFAV